MYNVCIYIYTRVSTHLYTYTYVYMCVYISTYCDLIHLVGEAQNIPQHTATRCNTLQHTAPPREWGADDQRSRAFWAPCWFHPGPATCFRETMSNRMEKKGDQTSEMLTRCSVLQCVAVCCSVLQCVAVCCSVVQCVVVCCGVLQCVAVCDNKVPFCKYELISSRSSDLFFGKHRPKQAYRQKRLSKKSPTRNRVLLRKRRQIWFHWGRTTCFGDIFNKKCLQARKTEHEERRNLQERGFFCKEVMPVDFTRVQQSVSERKAVYVRMCIYVCTYIHTHISTHMHLYTNKRTHTYTYIYIYTHTRTQKSYLQAVGLFCKRGLAACFRRRSCVAVCCSVLQCVAVCYYVLKCVAVCCRPNFIVISV